VVQIEHEVEAKLAGAEAAAAPAVAQIKTDAASLAQTVGNVEQAVAPVAAQVEAAAAPVAAKLPSEIVPIPVIVKAEEAAAESVAHAVEKGVGFVRDEIKAVETHFEAGVAALEKELFAKAPVLKRAQAFADKVLADARAIAAGVVAKLKPAKAPVPAAALSMFSTVEKGVVGNALSFAGKLASGASSASKIALPALGSALAAPFKLAGNIAPLGVKAGLWAILGLGVGGAVFAGYLHMEHNQERLIAQAREAAQADLARQYQEISEELARQQARVRTEAMEDLAEANKAADAEILKEFDNLDQAVPLPPTKEKTHAKVDVSGLNSADARADRLLERRSRNGR
jgi:hypothetical protein